MVTDLVNRGLHALKKRKNCENFTHFHNLSFISFTVYFSMAHVGRFFRKVPYFVDSNLNDGPTFHEMNLDIFSFSSTESSIFPGEYNVSTLVHVMIT